MENSTIFSAYNSTKEKLAAAGIEDYGFEARVIMRHVTGFDNKKILLNYNTRLNDYQQKALNDITAKRAARYPLQYILGEWEFCGLPFKVGPGVLIPRADTETVVETALEIISGKPAPAVLDLCAGSGAIGIAIALNREDSEVTLLEKYGEAARYLKMNIELNKVKNAKFAQGDVFEGALNGGKYDLIVSNPPYITNKDMGALQPEVLYEPATALAGGEDGLDFYRAIVLNYKNALKPGGTMCFEAGIGEAEKISAILKEAGFAGINTVKDLSGVHRVIFGTLT